MRLIADLHVHSHFSRATSRDLTVPGLLASAQRKGIGLLGTGDVTHPGWLAEVRDSLDEDGSGFLAPRPAVAEAVSAGLPASVRGDVRFALTAEVSSIWRKGERVRKVHTVVCLPSLAAAERFGTALGRLGNVTSDGRPILGIDPLRILLLAKDAHPDAFVIPAHVWTPHFSVFGAMSGFDSLEECFEQMASEVFAVETGLSSDVTMNRRWSALDRLALVSSSDAHSPGKLGREATVLDCERSFAGLVRALRGGGADRLVGTIEFFPEEGKYHLDGHRKCNVRTTPAETARLGGRCPECGARMTPGVLGRVEQLADRPEGPVPAHFPPQWSLIPLAEVLCELLECGPASQALDRAYERTIARLGPELELLGRTDVADVEREGGGLLAEAIRRMRSGRVHLEAGYDGEYGVVRVFAPGEVARLKGQGFLFADDAPRRRAGTRAVAVPDDAPTGAGGDLFAASSEPPCATGGLTPEQQAAVDAPGPCLLVAGPGTGKTRALVARAESLVRGGAAPGSILVVTFTNRAADEARQRLGAALGDGAPAPRVSTFHAFALAELAALRPDLPDPVAELTLDGLIPALVEALRADEAARVALSARHPHVLVDEFQDIDPGQHALLSLLRPDGDVFAVGDPDQAIYGFRGAEPAAFDRFASSRPGTTVRRLTLSHRLGPEVAAVAADVMSGAAGGATGGSGATLRPGRAGGEPVLLFRARDPLDEADRVRREVEALVGGTGMNDATVEGDRLGLGQIAVLGRTHAALDPVARALGDAGIPVERASDRPLWDAPWVRAILDGLRATAAASPGADASGTARLAIAEAGDCPPPPRRDLDALLARIAGLDAVAAVARLSVLRDVDASGFDPERVHLMTIHAAKGLEFEAVFVVGLEEGVLPPPDRPDRPADVEEERRLLFVAATRARRLLRLSWPASGGGGFGSPTRFLARLRPGLVEFEDGAAARRRPRAVQQVLL